MTISSVKTGAVGLSLALDNNYMEPIATTLVGSGGVNQVTFNDIPQTYKHLQLRLLARTNAPYTYSSVYLNLNGDFSSSYAIHDLFGNGSSVGASGRTDTAIYTQLITGANAISNNFGVIVADILDYANTNKNKTVRALGGMDNNGTGTPAGEVHLRSGLWVSTLPISSIVITSDGNFVQYSRFSLYGIKG